MPPARDPLTCPPHVTRSRGARTQVEDAMAYINLMDDSPDLLTQMNECIKTNNKAGLYSGCKKAVELAVELGKQH
eukprot:3630543-Prymnesium_polylepis.1